MDSKNNQTMDPTTYVQHLDLLESMESGAIGVASIATQLSASESSVYRVAGQLEEAGLVIRESNKYRLTSVGQIVVQECRSVMRRMYENEGDSRTRAESWEVSREEFSEELAFLSQSANRVRLLRAVEQGTASKRELRRVCAVSRSTVRRAVDTFESRGWVDRQQACRITDRGERAINAYEGLFETLEIVAEMAPFLKRLGPIGTNIPVAALADAEMIVASQKDPHSIVEATQALSKMDLNHVRGLVPIHTQVTANSFESHLKGAAEFEIITDRTVYRELLNPETAVEFKNTIGSEVNVDLRVHPDDLSFGLAVFDDRKVIIVGDKDHEYEAGIISSNPDIVEWASKVFEQHRVESKSMMGDLVRVAGEVADRSLPF